MPAGVYADDNSITQESVMLIWTVTAEINHGGPITGYDIEAETNFHPGIWEVVASGKLHNVLTLYQTTIFWAGPN